MNSDIIAKTELILDVLLKHDQNCENCCIHNLFKQIFENTKNVEEPLPNDTLLTTKSTTSIGDSDV